MNIFCLDEDPIKAVQMMCDKHIIKMILELIEILLYLQEVIIILI